MKKDENVFRVPQFIRIFAIIFVLLGLSWTIHSIIIFDIVQSERWFQKIAPFIILLLGINVLHKNLFTLNSIYIKESHLEFKFILKKTIKVDYTALKKLEFGVKRRNAISLTYEENGGDKQITIPRGIQDKITAFNMIVERSPNLQLDDFMKTVVTKSI